MAGGGSFSLLAEFLTHPVFVGAMTIVLTGGGLSAVLGYICCRTESDVCFGLAVAIGILTFILVAAFLAWCP